jgi:hypothetical protein
MQAPRRLATMIALAALSLGLAACGEDEEGTIPRENAEILLQHLSGVEESVDAGDCTAATTNATQFVAAVDALPKEVGAETKDSLRQAGENLQAMTQDPGKCEEPAEEEPTTTTDEGATGFSGEEG